MSTVRKFRIGRFVYAEETRVEETDVASELHALQGARSCVGLHIVPDAAPAPDGHWQFPRISAGWEPAGGGYVVQCYEAAESSSCILATASELSDRNVLIELGGLATELWPRELFVPYELALLAVLHFLDTGQQEPSFDWVQLNAFPREVVPDRLRGQSSR